MNENDVRKIVRDELKDLLSQSGISENDLIIRNQEITKKDINSWGITSLTFIRRVKDFIVFAGKKAGKTIKFIITTLGVWHALQFGSAFLFEKALPDANDLAIRVHKAVVTLNIKNKMPSDEPEKFIVSVDQWQNYTEEQYKQEVYTYLSNPSSNDLLNPGTHFFASTATPDSIAMTSSSYPDDFKIS